MKLLLLPALAACLGWGWLGLCDDCPPAAEAAPDAACEVTCDQISPDECLVRCTGPEGETCEQLVRCEAPTEVATAVTVATVVETAPAAEACQVTCERVSPVECTVRCAGPDGETCEQTIRCDTAVSDVECAETTLVRTRTTCDPGACR